MTLEQAIEQYRNSKVEVSWQRSLSAFIGVQVADVRGYLANEFGDPSFKLTQIVLADGTTLDVEGEHDFPYIAGDFPGIDDDMLLETYEATVDD